MTAVAGNWAPEVRRQEAKSVGLAAARQLLGRQTTERSFQDQVLELATMFGWRSYHTHRSEHSVAGYPDLTLVRRERLVFAELKKVGKRPTPAQQEWLDALGHVPGVEAYCWCPTDLLAIAEVLR